MNKNISKFTNNHSNSYDFVQESASIGIYDDSYCKEMELQTQKIEVQKQEAELSFQFSKVSLELQLEARRAQWAHYAGLQKNLYILICIIFTGVFTLIGVSLFLNKETVAIELIKMVVYISAGGFGGYGLSKGKKNEIHEKVKD